MGWPRIARDYPALWSEADHDRAWNEGWTLYYYGHNIIMSLAGVIMRQIDDPDVRAVIEHRAEQGDPLSIRALAVCVAARMDAANWRFPE